MSTPQEKPGGPEEQAKPDAAPADGQQPPQELLLPGRGDLAHHPHVDQGEAAVLGEEQVAGVGVGVEDAVHQDLLQIGAKQLRGQARAVEGGAACPFPGRRRA